MTNTSEEGIKRKKRGRPVDALGRVHCTCKAVKLNYVVKNVIYIYSNILKKYRETHCGWIFGAIAEFVDNSMDAKAAKLEISVESHYSKIAGEKIPMLSFIDDGHGMSHKDIKRIFHYGHTGYSSADDRDRIGRFGGGTKIGGMALGRDVIVLTQTTESRSIALLSESYNEGKPNLEIPVITYCRQGSFMEVDLSIQSKATANYYLKAIKKFSPFNDYLIGEKFGLFGENGKGTQVYIWNLEKQGSDYSLEWQNDDILIRSKKARPRRGQIGEEVPLDYSLRSYLEVIFLNPRMKLYVQGSLVKGRPLAKTLNNTKIVNGEVMGKHVQLTLGRSQQEWKRKNCGIFLYWHGRLIEAYRRVGDMAKNADTGRGVIGVIDVTDLMSDKKAVLVDFSKQDFRMCDAFLGLTRWLASRSNEYLNEHYTDTLHLKWNNKCCNSDHELVQCDKCRKWRILSSGFDGTTLPEQWVCCMPPYNGKCETPEEEVGPRTFSGYCETNKILSVSK